MPNHYVALVIGSGQGGTPLAQAFAKVGKTALVEAIHVGGTCINEGCSPTKTMVASGRSVYAASAAKELGVEFATTTLKLNMEAVRQRKRDIVSSWSGGSENRLKNTPDLDLIFGKAKFLSANEVEVTMTADSSKRTLTADKIFINAGCHPAPLTIKDAHLVEPEHLLNSTSIMELATAPEHLIVVGGGPIGIEFAQLFRRFGSRVSIVQRSDRLIPIEDPDISQAIQKILTEDGIELYLGVQPQSFFTEPGSNVGLQLKLSNGDLKSISASHVLNAAGRPPNTADLGLEAAGVKVNQRGLITVTSQLETTTPNIYALGDIKGGPAFTHISYDDHRVLKHNLISHVGSAPLTIENRLVPYCVFMDPQLGRVGLTETEARKLHPEAKIAVASMPMEWVARALEIRESRGMMKAVVNMDTGKILGYACLGYEGGEVMSMMQMAMQGGLTWRDLRDSVFAHPCTAESLNNLFGQLGDD